jgi:hypothetical protein
MVKDMEAKEAVLEIKTNSSSYKLPAREIDIDAVAAQFGMDLTLSDITVEVRVAEPPAGTVAVLETAAEEGGFALVVPAVDYSISCTYGGQTTEVTTFRTYVERTILIPDGVDPAKITTGIVVDAEGEAHMCRRRSA